jgi:hypothetical protein
MNVPDGALDDQGYMDVRRKKIFTPGMNNDKAEYITRDPHLVEAYDAIDRTIQTILLLSQTPGALFGLDKDGKAESGRALKFKLLSGLGKARRHGRALSEGLAAAAQLALQREDVLNGFKPGDYAVSCELSGKFIVDEYETAQEVQLLRNAGAISIENAVREAQGLSGDAQAAEVERIKGEGGPGAAAASSIL